MKGRGPDKIAYRASWSLSNLSCSILARYWFSSAAFFRYISSSIAILCALSLSISINGSGYLRGGGVTEMIGLIARAGLISRSIYLRWIGWTLLFGVFLKGRRDCVRFIGVCCRIEVDRGFGMKLILGRRPWLKSTDSNNNFYWDHKHQKDSHLLIINPYQYKTKYLGKQIWTIKHLHSFLFLLLCCLCCLCCLYHHFNPLIWAKVSSLHQKITVMDLLDTFCIWTCYKQVFQKRWS